MFSCLQNSDCEQERVCINLFNEPTNTMLPPYKSCVCSHNVAFTGEQCDEPTVVFCVFVGFILVILASTLMVWWWTAARVWHGLRQHETCRAYRLFAMAAIVYLMLVVPRLVLVIWFKQVMSDLNADWQARTYLLLSDTFMCISNLVFALDYFDNEERAPPKYESELDSVLAKISFVLFLFGGYVAVLIGGYWWLFNDMEMAINTSLVFLAVALLLYGAQPASTTTSTKDPKLESLL